jgi:mycothiol synthase
MCSMSSSLADRLGARAARPADAEAVAGLVRLSEAAVRGVSPILASDIRDWWRNNDPTRDAWLIHDGGMLVAATTLWPHGDVPNTWGDVHPEHLGRGFGTALLDLSEARARELGASAMRTDVFAHDAAAVALLGARGYRAVRHYYEMRIDLGDESPPEPAWPEGVRVEQFRMEDAEAFHDAQVEAFAEEFGFAPLPFEEWRRARFEAEDFDPTVWSVARDRDEVAGFVRCDPYRYGGGWIGSLGVRKPWRRRGLGLALLLHTFRLFHARGERSVGLGVDAENPTGALRLYEGAGMSVASETVTYERSLA